MTWTRRFELVSGAASGIDAKKFWEITLDGVVVRVTFGTKRKGSARSVTRELASPDEASEYAEREVTAKIAGGWKEQSVVTPVAPPSIDLGARALERAMIEGTTWSLSDFEAALARVEVEAITAVVFGARRRSRWSRTFRVTREGALGPDGDRVELDRTEPIGVVHRLQLTDEELVRWRACIRAGKWRVPFAQLDREVRALRPQEHAATYLWRWMSAAVPRGAMAALGARGWSKLDEGSDRLKRIDAKRYFLLAIDAGEVRDITVSDGRLGLQVAMGDVDRVAVSEMILDLESVGIVATWT